MEDPPTPIFDVDSASGDSDVLGMMVLLSRIDSVDERADTQHLQHSRTIGKISRPAGEHS